MIENRLTEGSDIVRAKKYGELTGLQAALYRTGVIAAFFVAWELVVWFGFVRPLFLAPPSEVWTTLVELAVGGELLLHVLATLRVTFIGFVLGMAVGVIIGFSLGLMSRAGVVAAPFITMMNSMPRIALAPLFVLWFGIGATSKVVLVFSLVVFIAITNTLAGTHSVESEYIRLARLLGARRRDLVLKIVLPATVPWIFAAMRLSFAYALAGAVVGEMFLGQRGLGYLIVAGSGVFNISQIFAALIVTVFVAYILDNGGGVLERRVLRWRPKELSS